VNREGVRLSVVVPAYREGAGLGVNLLRIRETAQAWDFPHEVIASVHTGRDETLEAARAVARDWLALRVLEVPFARGKGLAVRHGMLAAHGAIVVFTDADLSVPAAALGELPAWFDARPDVAVGIGSRRHPESRVPQAQGALRQLTARGFNLWVRTLTGLPFRDTQCGFKAFRREAAQTLFEPLQSRHFAFDVELLLRARGAGFRVEEMPVEWTQGPGTSVSVPRDVLAMGLEVVRLAWRFRADR
jgi:cellulose synthase/poly-beta-1,6-N-acetylglucosamine synthase-like glycosyltransferase